MAEFCKIRSDGSVMAAPNPLRIVVSNPSDERYRYEGWLEKRYNERPEYDPDNRLYMKYFTNGNVSYKNKVKEREKK